MVDTIVRVGVAAVLLAVCVAPGTAITGVLVGEPLVGLCAAAATVGTVELLNKLIRKLPR